MTKKVNHKFSCPTEFTLDVLGGKWKTVILCYLKYKPLGYADLRRLVPGLSDKILSERLRELTAKGLILKMQAQSRPATWVYTLSERGRSLGDLLGGLYKWGLGHASEFGVTVDEPLKRMGFRK